MVEVRNEEGKIKSTCYIQVERKTFRSMHDAD